MTNKQMLETAIARSGYKKSYLCAVLGITLQGLRYKTNGVSDFTQTEIVKLTELLKLTNTERDAIFLAQPCEK